MAQLASTNIGATEVGNAIGLGVGDFGLLCADLQVETVAGVTSAVVPHVRANRINEGAIYKPIVRATVSGPLDITDATGLAFFKKNGCGLTITKWEAGTTLAAFLAAIQAIVKPWLHLPSTGGAGSPHRIDDFRGYTPIKNASKLSGIIQTNPSIYQSTWLNGAEAATKLNFESFRLENNVDGYGVMMYSDVWIGETSTPNLGAMYFTVVVCYTDYETGVDKYYAKSLFVINTAQVATGGINYEIPLDTLFAAVDTGTRSFFSDKIDIERWYFITQAQIADWTDVTSYLSTAKESSLAAFQNNVYHLLLVKPEPALMKFYIKNSIQFRTYQRLLFENTRATARTLFVQLYITTAGTTVAVGDLQSLEIEADGGADLKELVLTGIRLNLYGFVTVPDEMFITISGCLDSDKFAIYAPAGGDPLGYSSAIYTGVATIHLYGFLLGLEENFNLWKTIVPKLKLGERTNVIRLENQSATTDIYFAIFGDGSGPMWSGTIPAATTSYVLPQIFKCGKTYHVYLSWQSSTGLNDKFWDKFKEFNDSLSLWGLQYEDYELLQLSTGAALDSNHISWIWLEAKLSTVTRNMFYDLAFGSATPPHF